MKKKLTSLSFFIALLIVLTFALSSKDLKVDKTLIVDKLENGFSYYIKENDFHDKKASLRLLVKVGSALETEEERGIAHFLEHMVFRGSKNFKDYEVIKYLESIGAEFGPDTNAFTTFDKTCYILEVPLNNKKDLKKAISFLSEFAFEAQIDPEKVEIERAIVLDELRKATGPYLRVSDKHLGVILKDTCYENRLPIGKEEVILNVSPEVIKNFYKKWYTPKNMALIAVGDFDKSKVKKHIEKYFSKKTLNDETRPQYIVNPSSSTRFSIVNDPEISASSIALMSISNPEIVKSKKDIKNSVIFNIIYDVFNNRLQEIANKNNALFIAAGAYENSFITNLNLKSLSVACWENNHLDGLKQTLIELKKIKENKISSDELKRAILARKEGLKKAIANIDKTENYEYIDAYFNHFIYEDNLFSKESVLKFTEKLFDKLTLEDINAKLKDFFANENWIVVATLPENIQLLENEITNTFKNVETTNLINEEELVFDENELIKPKLEIEGKVAKINRDDKANITEVVFENGLKAILTKTDLKKDEILIRSYALNGLANLDSEILDSAKLATPYYYDSGIAGIDKSSLNKLLDVKNSSLGVSLELNNRKIFADTTKNSFEDVIKLINRIFTTKNYQDEMFEKTKKMELENQKMMNLYPDLIVLKKQKAFFTNQNELFNDPNLEKADLNYVKNVIDTFFSNPKDFIFFIVGDFDEKEVIATLEKYLGSIASDKKRSIKLNALKKIDFPEKNDTHIIRVGTENKSACICGFDLKTLDPLNEKDWLCLELMRPIVRQRMFQALRLENAKTYSPYNFVIHELYPDLTSFNFFIHFTGPKDDIHEIKDIAIKTMQNILDTGPTKEELASAKEILKNDNNENLKYNSYLAENNMNTHMMFSDKKRDYKEMLVLDDNEIIDLITFEEMHQFMKNIFAKDKISSVIWLPKK